MQQDDFSIRVTGLSKIYDLRKQKTDTLSESIKGMFSGKSGNTAQSFQALNNVSFELKKGEVLGVIGRNGAGKSTLLRIIGEITPPTSGKVEINGRVASLLDIGTGFHPELSGRENVYLAGAILGMDKQQISERFNEIHEFSGIGDFIDVPVKRYSDGMFIRLAFSVAVHLDAEVILLDEVLSVGDSAFSVKSFQKIRSLLKDGRSVILVSHDLSSVSNLCTQCLVLDKGELKAFGPPMDLVTRYLEHSVIGKTDWSEGSTSSINQKLSWPERNEECGNDHIWIRRLEVRPSGGTSNDQISMENDFEIEIEYERLDSSPSILSLLILRQFTEPVLSVTPFRANDPALVSEEFCPGIYTATCRFSGRLFNRGLLSVSPIFVSPGNETLFEGKYLLNFRIEYHEQADVEFHYDGNFPGPFFPFADWEVRPTSLPVNG